MPVIMANNDYPILDGIEPSWADVSLKARASGIALATMRDIKAINTGRSVDIGATRAGGRKMRRTTGQSDQTASVTFYRTGWYDIVDRFTAAAPKRGELYLLSMVVFDLIYQLTPPGSVRIFERRILGCRIKEDALNSAEGTDPDVAEVTLDVMEIEDYVNGKRVVLL